MELIVPLVHGIDFVMITIQWNRARNDEWKFNKENIYVMDSSFDNDNTDANIYSLYVTRINICILYVVCILRILIRNIRIPHTPNKRCP